MVFQEVLASSCQLLLNPLPFGRQFSTVALTGRVRGLPGEQHEVAGVHEGAVQQVGVAHPALSSCKHGFYTWLWNLLH